jgi:hypothetical protein
MSDNSERLLGLANAAFPDLSDSERKVVEAAATGEDADFRSDDPEKDDPAKAETWGDDRKVRAAVLRWLCTDPAVRRLVDPKGIRIRGAFVKGRLDLSFTKVPFALLFGACALPEGLSLLNANLRAVALPRTHTGPITADSATFRGDLLLRDRFHAKGEVRLLGTRIRGNLDCTGGTFENPRGYALTADGVEVGGDVFLGEKFHAKGEVRLLGARIRGDLDCTASTFESPKGHALSADNLDVGGCLFLRQGFQATGKVSLVHAKTRVLNDAPASWPAHGDLDLQGFVYGSIAGPVDSEHRIEWLARQYPRNRRRGDYHPQPYEQLAAVLRRAGHVAESKKVLMAKEKDLRKYGDLGFGARVWNWILGATIGYGYRVRYALGLAAGIVLLGVLFFWLGNRAGLLSPTFPSPAEAAAAGEKRLDEAFCPWVYSLDTFLPIVDLHQEGRWLPNDRGGDVVTTFWPDRYLFTWGDLLCAWFWLEIGAGWLLTTLALAGLTGLIRRD